MATSTPSRDVADTAAKTPAASTSVPPSFAAQSKIRVVVRVRPRLAIEKNDSSGFLTIHRARFVARCSSSTVCGANGVHGDLTVDRNALQLSASSSATEAKNFVFDQVFDPVTSQVRLAIYC